MTKQMCLTGKNGGAYGQNGAHAGPETAPANGEQLLQEAMQADARGAARRNAKDPFANLGVQFKEVRGTSSGHYFDRQWKCSIETDRALVDEGGVCH